MKTPQAQLVQGCYASVLAAQADLAKTRKTLIDGCNALGAEVEADVLGKLADLDEEIFKAERQVDRLFGDLVDFATSERERAAWGSIDGGESIGQS